ncbi:MAG: hypothetical protein BGO31_09775 [Bacteroidetes bacterium 43-16]|nr:MAG: hypothetical protein BGO31_09775 [Bacteroidetes bacterium 43-16]
MNKRYASKNKRPETEQNRYLKTGQENNIKDNGEYARFDQRCIIGLKREQLITYFEVALLL